MIAIDPPLREDDFDALSDKLHGEAGAKADRDTLNYVRTGSDIAFSYKQNGAAVAAVYYGRKSGLVKLVYTYPAGDNRLAAVETPITGSLRATDDVRPAP